MMPLPEDFASRRAALAVEIARQRGELGQAYLNLERPIHYAEYGLRGFGFLRANPWIFMAAPALYSIGSSIFRDLRKKNAPRPAPARHQLQNQPAPSKGALMKWVNRGMELYQLYRRVRPYFM